MKPLSSFLAMALWACASLCLARPTLQVTDVKAIGKGGVNQTFLAKVDGRRWFFKRGSATGDISRYGNFEAELLVSRILRRMGVRSPQSRLVNIEGYEGHYLQTELVDNAFTGGGDPVTIEDGFRRLDLATVDLTEVRIMQLLDVLIGNGDRHHGNLFLVRRPNGTTLVVPIDNDLALATPRVVKGYYNWHFVAGFDGVIPGKHPEDTGDLIYPRHGPVAGTLERITLRNPLYERVWWDSRQDAVATGEYVQIAHLIRSRLSDGFLENLVGDLADEDVTFGDPRARKAEILRILKVRRDRLPDLLRERMNKGDTRQGAGLQWLQNTLSDSLLHRLGLGEKALTFLGARMFTAKKFDARETYFHFRAAGVEKLLARQAVLEICKKNNLKFPAKEIILAERGVASDGYHEASVGFFQRWKRKLMGTKPPPPKAGPTKRPDTGAKKKFYEEFSASRFTQKHGTQDLELPLNVLRVQAQGKSLRYLDARGQTVRRARLTPMLKPLNRAIRSGRLQPGEELVLERDVFVPGGVRAQIETGETVRWRSSN